METPPSPDLQVSKASSAWGLKTPKRAPAVQTSANGTCTDLATSQLGSQPPEDLVVNPNSTSYTLFEVLSSRIPIWGSKTPSS